MLYLETDKIRYELARFLDDNHQQIYRLSVVKNPHLKDNDFFTSQRQLPLSEENLTEVLFKDLSWQDLHWGTETLSVRPKKGQEYLISPLKNYQYRQIVATVSD